MISRLRVVALAQKTASYAGIAGLAYAAYAGLVYMAWTTIKPWSGTSACLDVCGAGFCGCSYVDTLYNETIFLIGLRPSWAVLPYLGHVFPGIS